MGAWQARETKARALKAVETHPSWHNKQWLFTMSQYVWTQKCMVGRGLLYSTARIGRVKLRQVISVDTAVGLASHLPWLLHLLLLTGVGSASMAAEASSARAAEASHEASENLSATTVQQSASPEAAGGTGARRHRASQGAA